MKLKISQIVLVIEKVIVIVIITVLVIVIVIITIFAKVICNCTDYISNVITTGPSLAVFPAHSLVHIPAGDLEEVY